MAVRQGVPAQRACARNALSAGVVVRGCGGWLCSDCGSGEVQPDCRGDAPLPGACPPRGVTVLRASGLDLVGSTSVETRSVG